MGAGFALNNAGGSGGMNMQAKDVIKLMQLEATDLVELSFRNTIYANQSDRIMKIYHLGKADAYESAGLWLQQAIREARGEV
jgi:hypothetical protein